MLEDWWVHNLYHAGHITELVSWIFWVLLSITLHELAHGWAAIWQGDRTPIEQRRMTLNPIVHMGPWSLLMFALIGIAWGVMLVDPSRFRWRRRGRIVVSGAGPAMNILLAIISLGLLIGWLKLGPQGSDIHSIVAIFLWTGGWLNLILALFNLLPVPPLDGASILQGLSLRMYRLYQHPQAQMFGMFLVLAILMTGVGGYVVIGCQLVALACVELPGRALDSPPLFEVLYP